MSDSTGKHRKGYVDCKKYRFKITCLIHGLRHLSDECKVLRDLGYNYSKSRSNNNRGQEPVIKKKFNRQEKNNDIVQHAVSEIILHGNNELREEDEAHENTNSKIN